MLQEQEGGKRHGRGFPQVTQADTGSWWPRRGLKRLYSVSFLKPLKSREKSAFFLINSLYTYTRLSHPFARHVFEFMQKGEP
ncbi:hypothetical protein AGR3A_Cc170023 [Agrobacterium tomkonis CFBP 6623]|uniref:Uncharacterized protein n=1 Tax=Agrobacterium tomkonis CFBP 6623 TaxID=1183432 RepID=A0A1S7NTB3_9HYPH|nr:hypothetical protein AGR3A_Cc170023 [Agrobacterium tomkonis CFBP 6623]